MEIGCSEVPKPLLTPPYFDQLSERHQLLSKFGVYSKANSRVCDTVRYWQLPRAVLCTIIWCLANNLTPQKNDAAVKREFKFPTPDNEEFSHTQHSPWIQSNGVEECVIKEVVDITVTSELEETFERLLELFEELRVRRVEHEDLSASLLLTRLPLLV